jgi:hypothetical protein
MPDTPAHDVRYLDLATDVNAAIDMMVKIAGSEVNPAEVEDWIRRQLH